MKNSENKLSPKVNAGAESDERLGTALSSILHETPTGDCLDTQDIAALVDHNPHTLPAHQRDLFFKHIASCEKCREFYTLAAELHLDEHTEPGKNKNNIIFFRRIPLAIAATLLIAVVSIYIFIKNPDIPKTADQLLELSPPPSPSSTSTSNSTSPSPPAPSIPLEEKEPDPQTEDSTLLKPAPPAVVKSKQDRGGSVTPKKTIADLEFAESKELERNKNKDLNISPGNAPQDGEKRERAGAQDTRSQDDIKVVDGVEVDESPQSADLKKSTSLNAAAATGTGKRDKYKKEETLADTQFDSGPKQTGKPGVLGGIQSPSQTSLLLPGQTAHLNQIKEKLQILPPYIPGDELNTLFKDVLDLCAELNDVYLDLKKESGKPGYPGKMNGFRLLLSPVILVPGEQPFYSPDVSTVSPNIEYFITRSKPGSIEYRFFNLALSGWSDNVGNVYNFSNVNAASRDKEQYLKWKALAPRLKGIFRQIAITNIRRLEQ